MNEQDIKKILPEWTLSYTLSEKKGEKLFQAERTVGEATKYSVIRMINIPSDKEEERKLRERFPDDDRFRRYISKKVNSKKAELRLLRRLCEKPGIVSMRESYDISNNDETSYMLIARYDYVEPLERYISSNGLTVGNAIRLGVDICRGIEVLSKNHIVHGNIRPENIYINSAGRFRLGGFDIELIENEKVLPEKTISSLRYISPEMCMGDGKSTASDIYALGMVLYSLLNGGKLPFEEEYGQDRALKLRLLGEKLPRPAYEAGKLCDIVMKACSFDPKDRYETPAAMKKELKAAFGELKRTMLSKEKAVSTENRSAAMTFSDNMKPLESPEEFDEKAFDKMAEKKRKEQKSGIKGTLAALGAMTLVLLLCVGVYFGIGRDIESYGIHLDSKYNYVYDGEYKQPQVTNDVVTEGKQYIVSYSNNKKIGTASVTVKGIGRFRGTKTKTFKINPPDCEDFKLEEVTATTATVSWTRVSSAQSYRIFVYNEETDSWQRIKTVDKYDNECVIEDLQPETAYRFKIKAACKSGDNVYSSKGIDLFAETLKQEVLW